MDNKLLIASVIVSTLGIISLFIVMSASDVPFTSPDNIDESLVGKKVSSEVEFSSKKEYNSSIVIYPKKYHLRLVIFTDKDLEIPKDSLISFTGKVDEDEYGLFIITDNIKIERES